MVKMNLQFFGGRGSGGSTGSKNTEKEREYRKIERVHQREHETRLKDLKTAEEKALFNKKYKEYLSSENAVTRTNASRYAYDDVRGLREEKVAAKRFSENEQALKAGLEKKFPPGRYFDTQATGRPTDIKVEISNNSATVSLFEGEAPYYRIYADNYGGFTVHEEGIGDSKSYATVEQALRRVSSAKAMGFKKRSKK